MLVICYTVREWNVRLIKQNSVVLACLIPQDVNPQLKGHLVGALNNGATEEEVKAVREVVIKVCEASGMKRLQQGALDGWGWREEVASLKPPKEKL